MVESMVERVAKAIALANRAPDSDDWPVYVADARAAIEAMREPTDAMVDAGEGTMCPHAGCIFSDMIDAALNEQVSG